MNFDNFSYHKVQKVLYVIAMLFLITFATFLPNRIIFYKCCCYIILIITIISFHDIHLTFFLQNCIDFVNLENVSTHLSFISN